MFNRTNLAIVALALFGALGGFFAGRLFAPTATPAPRSETALVGAPAPALDLPDPDGHRHTLVEWRGKLVLLNFWASWCGPCREEMPLLDRSQQRLAARGVQVIGIASDELAATREFLAKQPVSYPILVDDPTTPGNAGDLAQTYGNARDVLPYSVLIGRDGTIVAQRYGNFTEHSLDEWLQSHL